MRAAESVIIDGEPTGLYAAGWRQIWRINLQGCAYRTWAKMMPRIEEEVLDCALYLYRSEQEAADGTGNGGSGFLVGVPFGTDGPRIVDADDPAYGYAGRYLYAVTNRHVIDHGFTLIRLNTKEGSFHTFRPEDWIRAPADDLAVAPIYLDATIHKFKYVSTEIFTSEDAFKKWQLGPGDEVFIVGRLLHRDERQSNNPVVRFGHLATPGSESFKHPEYEFSQDSILIETHSIGGFSGAPVFASVPLWRVNAAHVRDKKTRRDLKKHDARQALEPLNRLLGVDWCHLPSHYDKVYRETAESELEETDYRSKSNSGFACIIPAWKLRALLDSEELQSMRAEEERKRVTKRAHGPMLDVAEGKVRTQHTKPKIGEPIEIPIPTEKHFFDDLGKLTRRRKPRS